jgi:Fe-Mn family superoxide dismutase
LFSTHLPRSYDVPSIGEDMLKRSLFRLIPSVYVPKADPLHLDAVAIGATAGAARGVFGRTLDDHDKGQKARREVMEGTARFRRTESAVWGQEANQKHRAGFHSLPDLPFPIHGGVPPLMTDAQAKLLHEVHHKGYVDRLNELTLGTIYEGQPLDAIIRATAFDATQASIHNAACEHWNHSFAWTAMRPHGSAPSPRLLECFFWRPVRHVFATGAATDSAATNSTSSSSGLVTDSAAAGGGAKGFDAVTLALREAATEIHEQGGGWAFLVWSGTAFDTYTCRPGLSPITADLAPVAAINMQYHAWYQDYSMNSVPQYITNSINAIDWRRAESIWARANAYS